MLRAALANFAEDNRATYAAPALILFGVVSAFVFNHLALQQFFIWHLLIFSLIVFGWYAKSRVDDAKLIEMSRASGRDDPDIVEDLRDHAPAARLRSCIVRLRIQRRLHLSVHARRRVARADRQINPPPLHTCAMCCWSNASCSTAAPARRRPSQPASVKANGIVVKPSASASIPRDAELEATPAVLTCRAAASDLRLRSRNRAFRARSRLPRCRRLHRRLHASSARSRRTAESTRSMSARRNFTPALRDNEKIVSMENTDIRTLGAG